MKSLAVVGILAATLAFHPGASAATPGSQATSSAAAAPAAKTADQPAFSVIGISVRTSRTKEAGGAGVIPALWQRMMQEGLIEQIPSRAGGGMISVYSDFSSDESEYTYTLGAKVTSTAKVPDGFVALTVPAGKYAVVQTDQGPLPEILPAVWKKVFTMSPAELGGERSFKFDYEEYPEDMDWQNVQVELHLGLK